MNPKGYNWCDESCNVHVSEKSRLEALRDVWYGKADVGDGADVVDREELDPWQKFAHDVVMDERHTPQKPLRLMMLGSAGTGKSKTARSFVQARRMRARRTAPAVVTERVPGGVCGGCSAARRRRMRR